MAILWARRKLSTMWDPDGSRESFEAPVLDWIRCIETDLSHLQSQLEDVNNKLNDLRHDIIEVSVQPMIYYADFQQIKDQLDLRQVRLSRLLTILAAIYLPFSFVSVSSKLFRLKAEIS